MVLTKKINLDKDCFINKELFPEAKLTWKCSSCGESNEFLIRPNITGDGSIDSLMSSATFADELLDAGAFSLTHSDYRHYGKYSHYNLPTMFSRISCNDCGQKHIVIFSEGETQPSKIVCYISGIWGYALP